MMIGYVQRFTVVGMMVLLESMATAQAPGQVGGETETTRWPAPVRLAQYEQQSAIDRPTEHRRASVAPLLVPAPRSHSHQIIQAPGQGASSEKHALHSRHSQTHPPLSSLRRRIQREPAMLPDANGRETWKTPYSYGYFGASAKRHWSLHYGYRDRYTEWRFR